MLRRFIQNDLFRCLVVLLALFTFVSFPSGCSSKKFAKSDQTTVRKIEPNTNLSTEHAPKEQTFTGLVVSVADGDTITVLDQENISHTVRLAGIDAPEKGQDFGNVSRRNLADLIAGKTVVVLSHKLDRYKRIVGKILMNDSDICLEQIRAGLAWHYKQFANEQSEEDRKAYADAEEHARSLNRGLWSLDAPIPPWSYRHPKNDRRGE